MPSMQDPTGFARTLVQAGAFRSTSRDEQIQFAELAAQALRALPSLQEDLSGTELRRLFDIIADAMFDILGDSGLSASTRLDLVDASCEAIEFAAAQGICTAELLAFWDLAIGAIPGGSPVGITQAVADKLGLLSKSPFETARRSAAVGLKRLASS